MQLLRKVNVLLFYKYTLTNYIYKYMYIYIYIYEYKLLLLIQDTQSARSAQTLPNQDGRSTYVIMQ